MNQFKGLSLQITMGLNSLLEYKTSDNAKSKVSITKLL